MSSSKISKKDQGIFEQLKALVAQDANIMRKWLDKIKQDPTAKKVSNPLTGIDISTTSIGGIYPSIIKWCKEEYKDIDFNDIPNAQNDAIAAAATSPVAKAKSPDIDIILIAENWKKNPTADPFTGETIDISIDPKSKYVILYQKVINKYVKHILKTKPRARDVLTVVECKDIQNSLPIEHAQAPNMNIFYDYLFIKYFVHSKTINYNTNFTNNIHIYIYKIIYGSHTTYRGETLDELLTNFGVNIGTSQLSLINLIMKLCYDIKNVLYMHESKIKEEAINSVIENRATLLYCRRLFDLSYDNLDLRAEILNYLHSPRMVELYRFNNGPRDNENHYIYYIYSQIAEHMKKENDIYQTLISICDCILKLYRDNNIRDNVYDYIKDIYNVNINIEPQMPIKPQLSSDLQLYNMRLNNFKKAVDAAKKASNDRILKVYNIKLKKWNEQLKKYEKDMLIYKKKNKKVKQKPLLELYMKKQSQIIGQRKFKSEDNIARPPSVSLVKYSDKLKAFTSVSNMSKEGTAEKYYVNDTDPYTQEAFEDMDPKKLKYVSDIVYKDGDKEFHFRFDTVGIYNYILKCKETCIKPKNFYYSKTELTDENFDEICYKIKFLTISPTYSSFDLQGAFDNCTYDNYLVLDYVQDNKHDYSKEIIGSVNVYLHIKLGGILFRVINKIDPVLGHGTITTYDNIPNLANPLNSQVISLPLFNTNPIHNGQDIYTAYPSNLHTYPEDLIYELNTILSKGELIGKTYFPYRKNNNDGQRWKTIMNLPKFVFSLNDTAQDTLDKLKTYQEEIQRQ